jgi:outer membrane protein OmpA-like peptidoglycan-associated protein
MSSSTRITAEPVPSRRNGQPGRSRCNLTFSAVLVAGLTLTGCASKKYVKTTIAPINSQVVQVNAQANAQIGQLKTQLEQDAAQIKAAVEQAAMAGKTASDALQSANQAQQQANAANTKADQAAQNIADLSKKIPVPQPVPTPAPETTDVQQLLVKFDGYEVIKGEVIPFDLDKAELTPDVKPKLDEVVRAVGAQMYYFIAVEGFGDGSGSDPALGPNRASAVVKYLEGQLIPDYWIHKVELGGQNPSGTANAKTKRAEVTIYGIKPEGNGNQQR